MITIEFKQKIVEAIKQRRQNYKSDAKHAMSLDISASQYSRTMKGELENVLSEALWISIARKLDVQFRNKASWQIAETETYTAITFQLGECQNKSISLLLCDMAGIGKTFAAKNYVKSHANSVYVDCSLVKTKQQLVREIAKEFGVGHLKKYSEVFADLIYYIKSIENPMIVLDEAGDLSYSAFLELKALWNATEYCCGWYMMGADGLRVKIECNLNRQKVGYAEIFRRYGNRFQRITPVGKQEREEFLKHELAVVAKANGMDDIQNLWKQTEGSLTRIYIEAQRRKAA